MGAMLRFKTETGKEVNAVQEWEFSDLCVFLWCCVVSACKCDGVQFDYSLMDFADHIDPAMLTDWAQHALAGDDNEATDAEKKTIQ